MVNECQKLIAVVVLLALVCGISSVQARQLTVYTATDENDDTPAGIDNKPAENGGAGWNKQADGANVGPIKPGQVIWFAFRNTRDASRAKYFKLEISRAPGSKGIAHFDHQYRESSGYKTNDTSEPISHGGARSGSHWSGKLTRLKYRFKEQPAWERFKFENESKHDVTFTVKAWSVCANSYPSDWTLAMAPGSFGAATAMGPSEIVEVQIFPESYEIDPVGSQLFDPDDGDPYPWTATTIAVDPDGEPRPLGGVAFTPTPTQMPIGPDHLFNLELTTLEDVETEVDIYAFDAYTGEWEKHGIDVAPSDCGPQLLPGDTNEDCCVNLLDITDIASNWLKCVEPEVYIENP